MDWLKKIKFVRKIQGGYTALAAISLLIVINGYIQLNQLADTNSKVFNTSVIPQQQINSIYSNFQKTQFLMMQFSMATFSGKFNENYKQLESLKKAIDTSLDSLMKTELQEDIKKEVTEVKQIWTEYKSLVADAIMSASVTQNYEMAADIAVTSGEEVGKKLVARFESVVEDLNKKANVLNEEAEDTSSAALTMNLVASLIAAIVFLICVFYLAPAISKPIKKLMEVVKEFVQGNYNVDFSSESQDEIGELTNMFKELQTAQQDKIYAAEQIAAGVMQKVKPASDKDSLAIAFNKEVETIEDLLREAETLIEANREGKLNLRGNVSKYSGGWGKLIAGVNSMLDMVVAPLTESSEVLSTMAKGDFTHRIIGEYKGDYQLIKNSVNSLIDSLNSALSEVAESASAVASSSTQISASSEEMAAGAQEQTNQASEVASSVEEMTNIILESNRNAGSAAQTSKNSSESALKGVAKVEETKKGIDRIVLSAEKTGQIITSLAKKTDQIGEITQVIDDIADQTNLLALNAAIEAARAGEQGRGFAVVADEVRKLAERTTKATKEIADTIKAIQKEAKEADKSMEESNLAVKEGIKLTEEVAVALKEILGNADKVSEIVNLVAVASEQQSSAAEHISRNIEGISSVTQESASGIQQIARTAEDLNRLTVNLQTLVSKFKIANLTRKIERSEYAVRSNGKVIPHR